MGWRAVKSFFDLFAKACCFGGVGSVRQASGEFRQVGARQHRAFTYVLRERDHLRLFFGRQMLDLGNNFHRSHEDKLRPPHRAVNAPPLRGGVFSLPSAVFSCGGGGKGHPRQKMFLFSPSAPASSRPPPAALSPRLCRQLPTDDRQRPTFRDLRPGK
jgi:hypothetical protein